MAIHIVDNQEDWDTWLFSQNQEEFLQSFDWGEFQKRAGNGVLRLRLTGQDGNAVGQVQGFVYRLGLGVSYLYIPRMMPLSEQGMTELLGFLKEKKYTFVRVEPVRELPMTNDQLSITSSKNRQPRHTLILNIALPEDELLAGMHQKTRYNIRLAEKKGVIVKQEKNADVFWRLNEETSARDRFKSHDKAYYAKMLESPNVYQLTAYLNDMPIASNMCIAFGHTFTYLHGASSNAERSVMAPYLLQWSGMRLARELGCTRYDMWGIAAPISEEHPGKETSFHTLSWDVTDPWTGITRFKAGFGGNVISYPEGQEIVLDLLRYRIYRLAKKVFGK